MTSLQGLFILLAAALSFAAGVWLPSANLALARRIARRTWVRQAHQLDSLRGQVRHLVHTRAEDAAEIDRLNQRLADIRLCRCSSTHDLLRRLVMVDKQPLSDEERAVKRAALEKEANLIWATMLHEAVLQREHDTSLMVIEAEPLRH
jgi:hypothetical protein